MMGKFLNFFEGVYYINLPERADRRAAFERRAADLQIPAERFESIKPSPEDVRPLYVGHEDPTRAQKIGCTMSHKGVVAKAKESEHANVLIFEDDCLFLDGFTEHLSVAVEELKQFEWDLLYLGGEPNNHLEQVSDNLYSMRGPGGIYTTHAYAVNSSFYDKIINLNPSHISVIDSFLLNLRPHERNLFATRELLAVQDCTYSDIWHYMTDSEKLMRAGWDKYIKNGIKIKNNHHGD